MQRDWQLRNRVRKVRQREKMRQADLAKQVGITRQSIIMIEKGRLNPSVAVSLRIARVLREPVDYIFYLSDRDAEPDGAVDGESEGAATQHAPKRGRPLQGAAVDEMAASTDAQEHDHPEEQTPAQAATAATAAKSPDASADLEAPDAAPVEKEGAAEQPAPGTESSSDPQDDGGKGAAQQDLFPF